MDNKLLTPKSWWKRNIKWLFPLVLILITAIYLLSTGNAGIGDFARAYADKDVYENALEEAKQNSRVTEILGEIEPIGKLAIAQGAVMYAEDNTAMTATITLKGSKGKGKMDIAVHKDSGKWEYDKIGVRIKDPKEEIIVLSNP